jgi:hypothetical protein
MTQHQVQRKLEEQSRLISNLCKTATDVLFLPPAVYLLDEIADMARQSPEAATAIAEAVQKKLAAKNPVVKFKVGTLCYACSLLQQRVLIPWLLPSLLQALRIIKHLSTKGCSHFQRCMQRHSTCVR